MKLVYLSKKFLIIIDQPVFSPNPSEKKAPPFFSDFLDGPHLLQAVGDPTSLSWKYAGSLSQSFIGERIL